MLQLQPDGHEVGHAAGADDLQQPVADAWVLQPLRLPLHARLAGAEEIDAVGGRVAVQDLQ